MQIRTAVATDVPRLLALMRRYWEFEALPGFDALRMEILLERLIHHGELGEIWVAAQGETLQGYLVVVHVLSLEHGGLMGEIDEFFVLPQARAQGVGGRLLASVEAALRERGMVRLQLQLALTNASARRFYETRGYHGRSGYALLDKPLQ